MTIPTYSDRLAAQAEQLAAQTQVILENRQLLQNHEDRLVNYQEVFMQLDTFVTEVQSYLNLHPQEVLKLQQTVAEQEYKIAKLEASVTPEVVDLHSRQLDNHTKMLSFLWYSVLVLGAVECAFALSFIL